MHVRLKTLLLLLISPLLLLFAAAYIQWGTVGIPPVSSPTAIPRVAAEPYGFPAWLRITHYVNFLFLTLLIRSGLQILMDQRLNHLHGAPLRLRVENQLGFKMVKWISAIEFVESVQSVGKDEGGYNEDHEYFGELANI